MIVGRTQIRPAQSTVYQQKQFQAYRQGRIDQDNRPNKRNVGVRGDLEAGSKRRLGGAGGCCSGSTAWLYIFASVICVLLILTAILVPTLYGVFNQPAP
ncbi:unnamed protein product, partial [Didymodactylos carnosus]